MSLQARYDSEWAGWKANAEAFAHERRFHQVSARVALYRPRRIFDVGCGDGRLAELMKQACPGTWIAGCDISDVALSRAKSLDACFRVDLNHECLPVAPESVDLVTMSEVLEHLVDPSQVLMDVRRVLVPGGCVVATVPNFAFWRFRLQALCGKVPPVTADDRHFHSFSAGSLARLLAAAGFRVVRMAGLRQRLHWLGSISYRLLCDTLLVEARREE